MLLSRVEYFIEIKYKHILTFLLNQIAKLLLQKLLTCRSIKEALISKSHEKSIVTIWNLKNFKIVELSCGFLYFHINANAAPLL